MAPIETPVPATGVNAGLRPITPELGLGLIANAWLVFLNEYVEQLDYTRLLAGAWNGFVAGLPPGVTVVDPPEFTGADPQADLNSFQTAYLAQAASLGATSPRQSAAAYDAIRGMVKEIGDCHTGFTTPAQLAEQSSLKAVPLGRRGSSRETPFSRQTGLICPICLLTRLLRGSVARRARQ
ncbi:MAG: hypothetical protein EBT47_09530 [Chloroflexi bacterium]|nr:hypothetical protein [Chloroflexota bacterium]